MVHHPLDDKEALSFYVDRMVHANNPDDHEALVSSIEQCGILVRNVHKADVVLVDPTVTDLTTLVDVPGTLVSYRYVESCMFFGKRLPFGNFVVELPTSGLNINALKSEETPPRALWRSDTPSVNQELQVRGPEYDRELAHTPKPRNPSSVTSRGMYLRAPSFSIKRRNDVAVEMPRSLRQRSVNSSASRTLAVSVSPSRLKTPSKNVMKNTGKSKAGEEQESFDRDSDMADGNADVLEPPMPPFRVSQGDDVKINLRSDPFFPWCVKYTRWATIVRPETNLCHISDHVFRIIPGLFRTTLYNIAMNDKYEVEREALEKAQEEGREIAEERNVQRSSSAKVDAVIAKMASQVLVGSECKPQTTFHDEDDGGDSEDIDVDSELPTTGPGSPSLSVEKSPPRPPPSRLLNRGKSKEAERWMQDYFRWNLTRDPRLSLLQLSYEISAKTYGVIPATSFHKYRTANKPLFRKIEAQVQRETGLDVAHVSGRRNASSTNVRRSLEELIGSDSEDEEPASPSRTLEKPRLKRLRRMRSPM